MANEGFERHEWLDALHQHYGRVMITPVHVAAEILLGKTDAAEVARSINRRGRKVGDDEMMMTTEADVADAVDELISLGYLESVFSSGSSVPGAADDQEEHVLELRMP